MAVSYNSYYLYKKYEKRGDQPWLPVYPETLSIDADGSKPKVVKTYDDPACEPTGCSCADFTYGTTSFTVSSAATSVTFRYTGCTKPDLSSASTYNWVVIGNHTYNTGTSEGYIIANVSANTSSSRSATLNLSLSGVSCQNLSISQQSGATPVQYRWTQSGTTCIGYDKYQNNIKEKSTDGGVTWTVVTPVEYSASTLIEADSPDCGYVPPTPTIDGKYKFILNDSTEVTAACDSSSAITTGETSSYKSSLVSVVIGDCVNTINNGVFYMFSGITSMTIPDSVTSLGQEAFVYCNFTKINIPNGVTTIPYRCFQRCESLTSVTIPDSVTSLGQEAFLVCSSLNSITIGSGLTSIGTRAFGQCRGLSNLTVDSNNTVYDSRNNCNALIETSTNTLILGTSTTVIPNTVTSISGHTFYGNTGLTSIVIPDSVTSVIAGSFSGCTSLSSVTIGNGLATIEANVFANCWSLTTINIPSGVTSINYNAFGTSSLTSITVDNNNTVYDSRNNCNAIIITSSNTLLRGCRNSVIPDTVTTIGNYAFSSCNNLTSITIPDSVTTIGQSAFAGCSSLTSITIPNSVTTIGIQAFYNCTSLTSVTIGNGVTSIGNNGFRNCTGLTSITINTTTPPSLGTNVFLNTTCPIYVPAGSVSAYQSAWTDYASRIQAIP